MRTWRDKSKETCAPQDRRLSDGQDTPGGSEGLGMCLGTDRAHQKPHPDTWDLRLCETTGVVKRSLQGKLVRSQALNEREAVEHNR